MKITVEFSTFQEVKDFANEFVGGTPKQEVAKTVEVKAITEKPIVVEKATEAKVEAKVEKKAEVAKAVVPAPKAAAKVPTPTPTPKAKATVVYEAPEQEEEEEEAAETAKIEIDDIRALQKQVLEFGEEGKEFAKAQLKKHNAASLTLLKPTAYGSYYQALETWLEDNALN